MSDDQTTALAMVRCPGCELELPEDDRRGQMEHMTEHHPDIVEERLTAARARRWPER